MHRKKRHTFMKKDNMFNIPIAGKIKAPKKASRTVVIGWFGAFNLGDEMMLDVTLLELRKIHSDVTIVVSGEGGYKTEKRYEGYTLISRSELDLDTIRNLAADNDLLFVSGGALLDDHEYNKSGTLAKDIALVAKEFINANKKVVVYGVSTNKVIQEHNFIEDYAYIIKHATSFSVRDSYSQQELLRVTGLHVEVVDDIAFADKRIIAKNNALAGRSIIAITPVLNPETIEYVKAFVRHLLSVTTTSVRLVLFYDENYNDAHYVEELMNSMGEKRFQIDEISSPSNSADLYNCLSDVEVYISMRYHGTLFGSAIGKKVISLTYDLHRHYYNKDKYLREKYNFGISSLDIFDIGQSTGHQLENLIESTDVSTCNIKKVHKTAQRNLRNVISSAIREKR